MKRTHLKRSKGMKYKSKKRAVDDRTRALLRDQYLQIQPTCEMCEMAVATDIDEIIGRGVMPGAQMLTHLFQALCRPCHTLKTVNPDWAYRHGFSAHAWDIDRIEEIKAKRVYCELSCEVDHVD